jgi:RIO-like serine/threonine protein kinase
VDELALHNLSRKVVDASMHALVRINESHILHNDFTPRNILVGKDGRVVIVHPEPFNSLCRWSDPFSCLL